MLKNLPIPYTKIQARGAQLEMPKKRNQLKKEIDQFLSLLASQLAESYSNSFDNETSLKDLFEDSLTTLPDCQLKQDLQTNFEAHYEELKGHLQELVSKPVLKPSLVDSSENITSSSTITSNEWVCSTTSIADIQQVLLNIESSDNKDITMYQKLAFSARWSGLGLGLILKHWSQSLMTSSFKEITTAIEFCSRAIAADHTLLLCLEFYIDILTHIVTKKDDTCHKELVDVLFSVLLSSHYIYQSQISSAKEQCCYDNHFAALLSFYIELCLLTRDHVTCVNLSDVLHVFSGNNAKIALDAILQVTMATKMANASFVLSLICSILCSIHIQTIIVDPPFYLSILCCKHQGHHFASYNIKDLNLIRKLESVHNIPIPATLNEWIWETNPKVCVQLGLKREWSCDQLHRYLTTDLNQTQVDLLLDLVTGHHESEAASLHIDIDNRERGSQGNDDDIILCNIAQSSFFIDNEGDNNMEEDIEDYIFCSNNDTNIDESGSTWDQSRITTTTTALPVVVIATSNKEHIDNAGLLDESLGDASSLRKESMTSHEQRNGFHGNHNTDDILTYPQISANKEKIIEDAPVIESLVTPVQKSSGAKQQTSSSKKKKAILKRLRKSGSLTPPTLNNISPKLLRSTVKRRLNIIK